MIVKAINWTKSEGNDYYSFMQNANAFVALAINWAKIKTTTTKAVNWAKGTGNNYQSYQVEKGDGNRCQSNQPGKKQSY